MELVSTNARHFFGTRAIVAITSSFPQPYFLYLYTAGCILQTQIGT